ncbi:cardiolipin synthase [Pseudomonas jessenii]|uniref:Cardiolipin synthase n=1 Tax=Pseudomonas jessenii TaxID=77298 RepID=A0A1H4K8A8_PSEJE|nr:cardiolipin synthase [Pseudomonas jessenii]
MDYFGPHIFGYTIALLHSLGMIAAIHAVLTVRTAQGSIAWALSLFFIPYLTLIPYLMFGRSTFDGYIKARRQANDEMRKAVSELNWRPWVEEALTARASSAYASLRAMPKLGHMPCLANNQMRLLINGQSTFEAIFDAIGQAKEAVLIQFFIVHDDRLGQRLQTLLLKKAAEGVAIYLLYDRIGSHSLPNGYVQALRDGGVEVKAFGPRNGWFNRFQVNFRNHRKIVVVDGILGFVGGHNVGDEYMGEKPPLAPWRDTHVQVRGPVVACMQESFAEDWFWVAHALPPLILPEVYPEDGVLCQLLASGPADAYETCSLFFVEAIHAATERIWITSPYFIPDEAVFAALRLAVLRGCGCAAAVAVSTRPSNRLRRLQPLRLRSRARRCSGVPLRARFPAPESGVDRLRNQRHRQRQSGQPFVPAEFRSDVADRRQRLCRRGGTDAQR